MDLAAIRTHTRCCDVDAHRIGPAGPSCPAVVGVHRPVRRIGSGSTWFTGTTAPPSCGGGTGPASGTAAAVVAASCPTPAPDVSSP